jgi:flagella basal body P-ring formation protein FlgA
MRVSDLAAVAAIAIATFAGVSPARSEDVWHATRMLLPGDVIRQEDVAARPLAHPWPDAVEAERNIIGQQIKRRVQADRPLAEQDVGPRIAVMASAPVTVLWSSGSLRMEMEGRAVEGGAIGNEVRVLNPGSGRTIRATVTGDGMVEVRSTQ